LKADIKGSQKSVLLWGCAVDALAANHGVATTGHRLQLQGGTGGTDSKRRLNVAKAAQNRRKYKQNQYVSSSLLSNHACTANGHESP